MGYNFSRRKFLENDSVNRYMLYEVKRFMQEVVLNGMTMDYRSSEAFKTLRTNIEFSGADKKVIIFTSCMPGEGKSTVSLSVASSLAESGKKVLFVDADLRKSVLAGRHKIDKEVKGLSHFLSGQAKLEEVLVKTSEPRLYAIFAGVIPPNPAELLESRSFEALLRETRKVYDYVIIDAPPLGSVIDGAITAKYCDAAVMVIAANKISRKFAKDVKRQLEKTGCPIIGAVLNKVNVKQDKYYRKYYGKY